jgi:tRNA-splicing ligase RtcB
VQADDDEQLWLMVHSGSRGMGQAIREHHERRAGRTGGALVRIDVESAAGRDYLHDMGWALVYAHENRARLVRAAAEVLADVLGAEVCTGSAVSCHHNFVACECHAGERLWVHRKGAIRAGLGEPGLVPGSMGTPSYHVEGRGEAASLCSSSHGAGRKLARGAARARISRRDVARQLHGVWYDQRLTDELRDEAPGAYKDIDAVLRAQRDLTRVARRLRPILGFKGG